MEFYANLHTHSTHSDGQFSPSQLARVAKEEGYRALSLTDHDTATGFGELKAECDKLGMECIFGTEFTGPSHLLPRPGKPDGQFGQWTASAVKQAQKDFGLEQTGVADAAFLEILYSK